MHFYALVLVLTGLTCVVVSLAYRRNSKISVDVIAIHKAMKDDRISHQLKRGPMRVDARLGVQFGCAFIMLGLMLEWFLHWFL